MSTSRKFFGLAGASSRIVQRVRRSLSREGESNRRDYAEMAKWISIPASLLFPFFGWFWPLVAGIEERMVPRILIGLAFYPAWWQAIRGRFGRGMRWYWLVFSTCAMVWFPWHMLEVTAHHTIWNYSAIFFAITFGVFVRSIDILPGLLLGTMLIAATRSTPFGQTDVVLVGISLTALFVISFGMMALRAQRDHIELQSEELIKANRRLQEMDRQKDEFTANIAHELKTPLAVAISVADELQNVELEERARNRLRLLMNALRQLSRQADNLLDLERFVVGAAKLHIQRLDAAVFALGFEESFTSLARSRDSSFQIVLGADEIWARFDAARLETVIFNLVSNAVKYTPPGGRIELHVHRDGDDLLVSVLDDGHGIPPDQKARIFERYQQVDRGPSTYSSGAGIGLALVKQIAEAHGGTVGVESTPGLGSLFEVRLTGACQGEALPLPPRRPRPALGAIPAATGVVRDPAPGGRRARERADILEFPEASGIGAQAPRAADAGSRRLVLVIDDNRELRHLLRDMLSDDFRIVTARDGLEGFGFAKGILPDLIISDFAMPGLDGRGLLAAVRNEDTTRRIPILFLTATPDTHERIADLAGPTAVLTKPFLRADLMRQARTLIEPTEG